MISVKYEYMIMFFFYFIFLFILVDLNISLKVLICFHIIKMLLCSSFFSNEMYKVWRVFDTKIIR